jgi:hypothetical protein
MNHQLKLTAFALVLAALLTACGSAAPTATPTAVPKPAVPATATTVPPTPVAAAVPTRLPSTATAVTLPPTATPVAQATTTVAPTATKPAPTATQAPAEASTGSLPDIVLNAQRAAFKQKTLRIRTTIAQGDGSVLTSVVEMVPPDRVHITAATYETIAIRGVGAWQKTGGQWQAVPGGAAVAESILGALDASNIDELGVSLVVDKIQALPPEILDGKPMRVYQFVTTTNITGTAIEGTSKLWIGATDGLPYKSDGTSGSGASLTKNTSVYEYDSSIKIDAPM